MIARAIVTAVFTNLLVFGAGAGEWFVHADPAVGDDSAAGSRQAPLSTIQRAVTLAEAGDTISLLPEGALFRQSVLFNTGDDGITLQGNDCVLSGTDEIDEKAWQAAGEGLWKARVKAPLWGRCFLVIDGEPRTMGRTPATKEGTPFPEVHELQLGDFRYDAIDGDDKTGRLTVRMDSRPSQVEWGVRANGVATGGTLRGLVVRNVKARHCLNDGFNIHGDSRELLFENIEGFKNFDEGFSAHDTCEATIIDSRFYEGDHAVADVNAAETRYERCFFGSATNCSVLFQGGVHSLIDCVIEVGGKETALSIGPSGAIQEGPTGPTARLSIDGLKILAAVSRAVDTPGGGVQLGGGTETTLVGDTELSAPGGLHVSPTAILRKMPSGSAPDPAASAKAKVAE